jgi:hypothetical protein
MAVIILSFVSWLIELTSMFLINHFELFGLHQVANNKRGKKRGKAAPLCPSIEHVIAKSENHPCSSGSARAGVS